MDGCNFSSPLIVFANFPTFEWNIEKLEMQIKFSFKTWLETTNIAHPKFYMEQVGFFYI
jgi:hypothetical protein